MPWTADEFKKKHWGQASPSQARKASSIANAILKSGGDEGVAIATGICHAKGQGAPARSGLQSKINTQRKPK